MGGNKPVVFGGTRGTTCTRSATHLLFVDQWDSGSSTGCLRPEACSRNSIFESVDLGRATSRVRAPCGGNDRPDRSGPVCFAQRYPLSPKRLPELPTSRALSEQPAINRHESRAQGRSERP